MKRFLKTLVVLVVSLFFVVSGVDRALDHFAKSKSQCSFTFLDEQGSAIVAYNGDLSLCKAFSKPALTPSQNLLHRS